MNMDLTGVDFFKKQFSSDQQEYDYTIIPKVIPKLVTENQNA